MGGRGQQPERRPGLGASASSPRSARRSGAWGAGQLLTGWWSDRLGRKHLITTGMLLQAAALGLVAVAATFPVRETARALLGAGPALVHPTLLAVIGDAAHLAARDRAVGVHRLWHDGGSRSGHWSRVSSPTPTA
ncbi:MFS transporter [Kitasatospora sp. NPDC001540]|uniref:MFS transporter n=1 Tax=Kitasatospora sp. NPDC001540 TaxID=3364014 RepID=UPI0036887EBF